MDAKFRTALMTEADRALEKAEPAYGAFVRVATSNSDAVCNIELAATSPPASAMPSSAATGSSGEEPPVMTPQRV
jgi:hypothetical protein